MQLHELTLSTACATLSSNFV